MGRETEEEGKDINEMVRRAKTISHEIPLIQFVES